MRQGVTEPLAGPAELLSEGSDTPQPNMAKSCQGADGQTYSAECIPSNIPNNLPSASDTCVQLNQQNGEYSLK